jgi:hypothetical protein
LADQAVRVRNALPWQLDRFLPVAWAVRVSEFRSTATNTRRSGGTLSWYRRISAS